MKIATESPKPECRYCGKCGGGHWYGCPVVEDKGTNAPGQWRWWK